MVPVEVMVAETSIGKSEFREPVNWRPATVWEMVYRTELVELREMVRTRVAVPDHE
jgi:hypothetical protein